MLCLRRFTSAALVATLSLTAGLAGTGAAHARDLGEGRPPLAAPSESFVNRAWGWIAGRLAPAVDGLGLQGLWEAEGWGIDPNGGGRGAPLLPPPDPGAADRP